MDKWDSKQARELFSKTVNSFLIDKKDYLMKDEELESILGIAEKVVNRAFKLYSSNGNKGDQELPL